MLLSLGRCYQGEGGGGVVAFGILRYLFSFSEIRINFTKSD